MILKASDNLEAFPMETAKLDSNGFQQLKCLTRHFAIVL